MHHCGCGEFNLSHWTWSQKPAAWHVNQSSQSGLRVCEMRVGQSCPIDWCFKCLALLCHSLFVPDLMFDKMISVFIYVHTCTHCSKKLKEGFHQILRRTHQISLGGKNHAGYGYWYRLANVLGTMKTIGRPVHLAKMSLQQLKMLLVSIALMWLYACLAMLVHTPNETTDGVL